MALSKKDKKQIFIIAGGLVAIAIIVPIQLKSVSGKPKPPTVKTSEKTAGYSPVPKKPDQAVTRPLPVSSQKVNSSKMDFLQKQKELRVKEWGKDPFYPFEKKLPVKEENNFESNIIEQEPKNEKIELPLNLSGISRIGSRYYVTINRKMLSLGDSISGYIIKNITKELVCVEKDGEEYEIRLNK